MTLRAGPLVATLLVAGGILWWKGPDLARTVSAAVPATAPYLAGFAAMGETNAAATRVSGPAAVPVVVASVERRPLAVTLDAVGTVQPLASIAIKARIDSQIAEIAVQEGAKVRQGDLLLKLDDRALKAQLAQTEATVSKDRAQIAQTRRDLARAEDLLAKRITSEVQRDTAATAVKVQEAQLAADEATRDALAAALSYTEIRAPVSGRIGSIALKVGTTMKSGDAQPITTLNQIDPIYVTFSVPQTLFGDLRRALAIGAVSVEARVGGETTIGSIAFVENTVDLATGTVLAKAIMPNAEERLWPGAFVNVKAVLGVQSEAVAVPSAAVQLGQQGSYVFVVRENRKAELVAVTVERQSGPWSVVSSGLSGGERVVVDGQLRLVPGATVQIQNARSSDGVAKSGEPADASRRS